MISDEETRTRLGIAARILAAAFAPVPVHFSDGTSEWSSQIMEDGSSGFAAKAWAEAGDLMRVAGIDLVDEDVDEEHSSDEDGVD